VVTSDYENIGMFEACESFAAASMVMFELNTSHASRSQKMHFLSRKQHWLNWWTICLFFSPWIFLDCLEQPQFGLDTL